MSETFRTTIDIAAAPERVFDNFLKPELLVRWMGDFAQLDANPGGLYSVDINGVLIRGHFVRIERPSLLEIAWGEAGNAAMPPGTTRLIIRFTALANGTRIELEHTDLASSEAIKHAVGWPHFLGRLASTAAGHDPGRDPWATATPGL
jgi:uncharacterized protein YndB with AHSA1/START domain